MAAGSGNRVKGVADTMQVGLAAAVLAVTDGTPRVATMNSGFEVPDAFRRGPEIPLHRDSLPWAPFDPARFRTLQDGVRAVVEGLSGLNLRYVEQLYTFGDRHRDPWELFGGPRSLVVGYLALVRPEAAGSTAWRPLYDYFPWEDWRGERPALIDAVIRPALRRWAERCPDPQTAERRAERAELAFALREGGDWDTVRVLERYELLYEAGLVVEAGRDRELAERAGEPVPPAGDPPRALGRPMARDGRRMLAAALERLRGKLTYRPVVFELLPPLFTLHQLQQVVEALSGKRLHKQNFRRLMLSGGFVEPTGRFEAQTGGRPAELHRFRRAAIHERTSARGIPDPQD